MKPRLIGETWRKYPTEKSTQRATFGLYECGYCGTKFETQVSNIHRGITKSCGCLVGEKHGLTTNKFYRVWSDMIGRCINTKNKDYKNYGERGITVCDEWLDIKKFIAWAERTHPNTEGYSLDRIDNSLGYSPENCRWADRSTQNINKRISKRNTSGFVGVNWSKSKSIWVVNIKHHKVLKYVGGFKTIEEAVLARDQYIIKNKLPHKLSTQY